MSIFNNIKANIKMHSKDILKKHRTTFEYAPSDSPPCKLHPSLMNERFFFDFHSKQTGGLFWADGRYPPQ